MKNLFTYKLGILILLIIPFFKVFGQPTIFNKVLPPDGKSFVTVEGIAQDADGYMWFSTRSGLYRYDGYQFITYNHDPLDANSLITDSLTRICIDNSGKIWIGTMGYGLECFDPATGHVKHYKTNADIPGNIGESWITSMLVDSEGTLWVASGDGLNRYDKQTDSFIHFRNIPGDTTSLSSNAVNTIYEDRQGTIWVGTGEVWNGEEDSFERGGLNRLDKNTGTFTRYKHDPNNPNSLINNKVSAIFEDSKGTFWVGTAGDGLHTMDREKGTFVRHTYDSKHLEKLSRPPFDNLSEQFKRIEFITFIHGDATGAIWIATLHAGLNYYDPKTGKTTYLESAKYFDNDYDGGTPWQAYTSRDGVLWISSLTGFLYRIDPFKNEIPHFETSNDPVRSFYEEPNGSIWIGTENALYRNDKSKGIVKRDVIDVNPAMDMNGILTIFVDKQNKIWVGTREGFAQWDRKTESYIPYFKDKGQIWSIYEDRDSNLWIGTDDNLSLFDRKTGLSTQFFIYSKEDTINAPKNSISSILQDKTGKLWVGTWYGGGINLFNPETGKFKTYLDGKGITTICEDADGILWTGLWTGGMEGLYKYDRDADEFIQFTEPIKSSEIAQIRSMVEDNQKYLWIATSNQKLIRLNPRRNALVIYDKKNGIENSLLWNSVFKGRNGNLYFGNENGYFSFDPMELTKNDVPPNILLTDFLLAEKPVKPGNDSPLKEGLVKAKEIRLSYNQNIFTFEFAALDYSNPEETKYSYMLENYDTDWRKENSERRAYYFNVPPGKYVFHVKAVTINGGWAGKKIDVIILPPWWKTWWAYFIYGLLFIALVFSIDRFQRRRLLKAEKERNRERELAQAKEIEKAYIELGKTHETLKSTQSQLIQSEKMASLGELTAGIAHEIQNPLNFVNNFSEVNKELIAEMREEIAKGNYDEVNVLAKDVEENEEKINHHGKRADAIVKGMLQHSRTSSGVKEPTDINALADEYLRLAYHGLRAKDKSFNADFKTEFDENLPKIYVIPQDIGRVLLNLINNAFYAVNERSKNGEEGYNPIVSVNTAKVGHKLEIKVTDNGNGIPDNIKDKVFQPFFTTKPTGQGTGLGLSLSYDIVKAHGGELKIETKEGEGTTFTILLSV